MKKAVSSISLATIAALTLAACNGDESAEDTAVGDVAAEGSLTIACTPAEELCQAWANAFEEETGIETNYVRLSSGEAVARFQAAGDNPEFDVWHGGPVDGFIAADAEGFIEPYVSPNAEAIDAEVKAEDGTWTGVYLGALGFCSNTDRLEELGVDVPTSWDDLLAPELEGEIMMAHPSTSGTAYTALWSQVERLGSEEAAFDYMRDLDSSMLQYTRSGSAPAQAAGRGEVAVSLVFAHDCTTFQLEGFDALETSFPEEGTGYEIGGVAQLAGSDNPEAAQAYIDWALTPAAQDIGPEVASYQSLTHPDAVVLEEMTELDEVELVDYDFVEAGEQRSAMTARFDEEIAAEPEDDDE